MSGIRFYCGISETRWNHHPVAPGAYACVSPVYGKTEKGRAVSRVFVPEGTMTIQDSGAFPDGPTLRLTPPQALERQETHAERFRYTHLITHRASYDLLIDEKWKEGTRYKQRWTEKEAECAVQTTIEAAYYLSMHRGAYACILSAQGVSCSQYMDCTEQILPFLQQDDMFGLGGWCVVGKYPAQMMPVFRETVHVLIPRLAEAQVRHVHIWGVCYAPALGLLLWLCDKYGLSLSTDSAGPTIRPCMGKWGYASWYDTTYRRPPPETRGAERARHVIAVREWLDNFSLREPQHYCA